MNSKHKLFIRSLVLICYVFIVVPTGLAEAPSVFVYSRSLDRGTDSWGLEYDVNSGSMQGNGSNYLNIARIPAVGIGLEMISCSLQMHFHKSGSPRNTDGKMKVTSDAAGSHILSAWEYVDTATNDGYLFTQGCSISFQPGTDSDLYIWIATDEPIFWDSGTSTRRGYVSGTITYRAFVPAETLRQVESINGSIQAIQNSANTAATKATNAEIAANYIRNNMLSISGGIVQDASGTVLSEARAAKNNASTANTNITTANNTLNNSNYGLNALNNKLLNLDNDTTNIESKINNLNTSNTNIQTQINNLSSRIKPEIIDMYGDNGATCTTTTQFKVRINAANATKFRVRVSYGSWSSYSNIDDTAIANGIVNQGTNVIQVEALDEANGNVGYSSFCIQKL